MDGENKYPWSIYTLKWGSGKVSTTRYVLYVTQIAVLVILAYLSIVFLGPLSYSGISFFYFVASFELLFTMWWGIWGVIGSYLALVIGGGLLVGMGIVPSLLTALSAIIATAVHFVIYRGLLAKRGYDPLWRDLVFKEIDGVKAKRAGAWAWFIIINGIIINAVSTEVGLGFSYLLGLVPPGAFWFWWAGYFVGDILPFIVLMPILVAGLSGIVTRSGLVNSGWLT